MLYVMNYVKFLEEKIPRLIEKLNFSQAQEKIGYNPNIDLKQYVENWIKEK